VNARQHRLYVAFDDTDTLDADRGTGKVGRWFADELPDGWALWAVVRQQLLVHPDVPYTSHNSAAVCVVDRSENVGAVAWETVLPDIVGRASRHLERHWMEGSDPGLCVAAAASPAIPALVSFGRRAAIEVVDQEQARRAAEGVHLSGHGGTNDGIIGAAAGVGLTAHGWNGRLVEYSVPLRELPDPVSVADLEAIGVSVLAVDRDGPVPAGAHLVRHDDWLRPRLWAGVPVVPVQRDGVGRWLAIGPRTA
jgi:tRNA(Ile2) C34 agmatinyltransferase TiaS